MARNPIGLVVGVIMAGTAALMLLPALVDLVDGNDDWIAFALSATATGFVGIALGLSSRFRGPAELTRRRAFLLTVAVWATVTGVSALPLLGLGLSYTDAFFETMSGLTTTGSTVLVGLDALPRGILLWRSLLQWIGGIGIIAMAIVMLPFLRVGGMQLFLTESSSSSDKVLTSAYALAANIGAIYVLLTGLCAGLYYALGMHGFDAVCHAMATVATGGFSTHDRSFAYFDSPAMEWTATAFMLAGAMPFVAYVQSLYGRRGALVGHPEVRVLVGLLAAVSVAMAVVLAADGDAPFLEGLRLSAFHVTSIVTTTGFASTDYSLWGPLLGGGFFILTFVGGCTGSTAGAIKIYRHQIMGMMMVRHLKLLTTPSRVLPLVYAGKPVSSGIVLSIVAFMTAYLVVLLLVFLALAGTGLDFVTALSGAATALGNVGPGLGETIGPAGNFATLPDTAKWVLCAAMLLGRLELLTVLVLLDPDFWR